MRDLLKQIFRGLDQSIIDKAIEEALGIVAMRTNLFNAVWEGKPLSKTYLVNLKGTLLKVSKVVVNGRKLHDDEYSISVDEEIPAINMDYADCDGWLTSSYDDCCQCDDDEMKVYYTYKPHCVDVDKLSFNTEPILWLAKSYIHSLGIEPFEDLNKAKFEREMGEMGINDVYNKFNAGLVDLKICF